MSVKRFLSVLLFGFVTAIFACVAAAKPPKAALKIADASVSAPRFGATFVEAGVDSAIIGDSGLLTFQLVTPLAARFPDEQPVTAIEVRGIYMDLVQGTVTATIGSIGGVPQQTHNVGIILPPATETNFVNSLKAQIAAQLGVTFQ